MADSFVCGQPWACPKGHMMGVSKQLVVNEHGRKWRVDVLYKLRISLAVDCENVESMQVPANTVDCRIEGTVHDITCSICGQQKTWWRGKQSLDRLLTKMGVEVEHG